MDKKLYRSTKDKKLAGVCGGLGEFFNIDPTLVRLGFVALCILAGGGLIAYIVAAIIVPVAPEGYDPQIGQNPGQNPGQNAGQNAGQNPTDTDDTTKL